MATSYTIRCPHCGTITSYGGGKAPKYYGSPIKECPSCRRPYFDDRYREMAFRPKETVLAEQYLPFCREIQSLSYELEYDLSAKRLKNPHYVASLIYAGYSVPQAYRESAKDELKKMRMVSKSLGLPRYRTIPERVSYALGKLIKKILR